MLLVYSSDDWSTLPANMPNIQITASIATGIDPDLIAYEDISLTLNILPIASVAEVGNTLTALAANSKPHRGYAQALRNFERGQLALTNGDIYRALSQCLAATDKLANIHELEANAVMKKLDQLIRDLEVQL